MSEHALAEAGKRDLTVGGGVEGVDGVGDEAGTVANLNPAAAWPFPNGPRP